MLITYTGDIDSPKLNALQQGAAILTDKNSAVKEMAEQIEMTVHFSASASKLSLSKKGTSCSVTCREPAHFFRGLNYLLHHLEEDFELEETSYFKKNGFMLDCSRNAVATVQTVKKLIQTMAKAGMNQLFLYTEDTYEVPGFPYFGTYRGRYSQEELREMDNYAALFGIELIPCIQTLAHLRNFLKWPEAEPLKDSSDILLVGSEKVYDFIRQILTSLKDCFRTRTIHIGMDEAVSLGLGRYLRENGYRNSSELIQEHSSKVQEICKELGWKPMIWSDMYITANTGKGYYAVDENTDTSGWKKPDPGLGLVYWDYYHWNQKIYENQFRVHKELSNWTVYAGGVWNWNGIAPNYGKAIQCMRMGLKACRSQNIQEVFATGWMDNGAETPLEAIYPGLIAFAHLCFHEDLTYEALAQDFRDCVDASLDSFLLLDEFDALFQGKGNNLTSDNPSKYLLYQDALLGMFDYHIQNVDTNTYYSALAQKLENALSSAGTYENLFQFYHAFALVLADKADLGIRLKNAYDSKDLSTLESICEEVIPRILENLEHMHMVRETLWMQDAKPFGYELMDIKLGGLSLRLKACVRRIQSYLNGQISSLEELEQERLPYWPTERTYPHSHDVSLNENLWSRIVSGCDLVDTV